MLTLARKLHRLHGQVSAERLTALGYTPRPFDTRHTPTSNWGRVGGLRVLYGSTLGIIGLGEIGREVARRALAFDMPVVYTQRTRLSSAEEAQLGVEYASLDHLLARSDWVVPQLPADPSTRGLLDRARLARMKPGACLVNVSRADVVDRAALLDALTSGHLGGLGLDPQYDEPAQPDDPLLGFDNVVLTPRLAAQPRFNALDDIHELIVGLGQALATRGRAVERSSDAGTETTSLAARRERSEPRRERSEPAPVIALPVPRCAFRVPGFCPSGA
jgi:phosphoglycerate dehydrogenase-like enzyme